MDLVKNKIFSNGTRGIIFLVLFGVLALLLPFFFYIYHFTGPVASNSDEWSNLGEYLGGISGTVLNFLTFMAMIYTFTTQNQNSKNRDDQDIFFKLLDSLGQIVSDTTYKPMLLNPKNEIRQGDRAFRSMYTALVQMFREVRQKKGNEIEYKQAFEKFHRKNLTVLGHYFRFVYNILKFIDNSSLDYETKKQLVAFLKSSLSQAQLSLIFFNCIFGVGEERFKPLIEKYGLFDNLDTSGVTLKKFQYKYNKSAFEN